MGAMHEGARNLAHQAKIREAQEYLRQQNAQKQQQRLGLAHPPQLQYQPQPPPPPPPPPPSPPPLQSVPPPRKRGLAEMAEGDSQHGALPSSVQQAQLYLTEAGQAPPEESVVLKADGERYELPVLLDNQVGEKAHSCVLKDKSGQKTLLTLRGATQSVTASSAPVAPGTCPRASKRVCWRVRGHTHLHARTHTHTVEAMGPSAAAAEPRATGGGGQVPVTSAAAVANTATQVHTSRSPLAQVHPHPQAGSAPV